jgi:DNA-binding transcriptional MerR regulator
MSRPTRFTIRSVCALTGVNPNTLRAWERRYGLVQPERTASGYRLYTMQDVERLRQIQDLLNAGIPAGQIAKHLPPAGAGMEASPRPAESTTPSLQRAALRNTPHTIEEFAYALAEAAILADDPRCERLFSRAVGLFGVSRAFPEVLLAARNLLETNPPHVAGCPDAGRDRLTAYARKRIDRLLAGLKPLHQRPLVVCAHVGADPQEGQLMEIALELGMARVSTSYVVPHNGDESLAAVLNQGSVRALVLTCSEENACSAVSAVWQKCADRLRGAKVLALGPPSNCDWLRSIGASFLNGGASDNAQTVLKALGRA